MKNNKWQETNTVLVAAMLLLFIFLKHIVLVYIALALCFMLLFVPFIAKIIHRSWIRIGEILGSVIGKVFLTVVYILFILPLAFLFKKKLSINLKLRGDTYFKRRDHLFVKKDMENPW